MTITHELEKNTQAGTTGPRLSVTVITKNAADDIDDCLRSVAFADEIIVVDCGSNDETVERARAHTTNVFHQEWLGYGGQKNYASNLSSGDWILNIDADERASSELVREIQEILRQPNSAFVAYQMPRRNYVLGRWLRYGGWHPDPVVRLWRRREGKWSDDAVHERLEANGPVGTLRGHLEHYTYRCLNDYVDRQCRYARLSAEQRYRYGFRVGLVGLPFKFITKFLQLIIVKRGFLDGRIGWLMAVLGSAFAVARDAMIWELDQNAGKGQ